MAKMKKERNGYFDAFAEALDRIIEYLESRAPERLEAVEEAAAIHDASGEFVGSSNVVYQAGLIREYRASFSPEGDQRAD